MQLMCVNCVLGGAGRLLGAKQVTKAFWGTGLPCWSGSVCRSQVHVVTPCWSCWLPLFRAESSSDMCLRTCCRDPAGRPEPLGRAPAHSMKAEGDINNGAHWHLWLWQIPAAPGEVPWLPSLFSTVPLLFVVQKVVLWWSDIWINFLWQVDWGSWLKSGRHLECLGHCPIGPGAYGDALLFLLAPLFQGKRLGQCD